MSDYILMYFQFPNGFSLDLCDFEKGNEIIFQFPNGFSHYEPGK